MNESQSTVQFQIRKDDFKAGRLVRGSMDLGELGPGEVIVEVERFAVTSNNVTYAATGDRIGYWQFFPPLESALEGESGATESRPKSGSLNWGVVPVWGFATVVASSHDEVPVGERLYGYFPPASHLRLEPIHVKKRQWIDGSAHRSQLPVGYNVYQRVDADPAYDPALDDFRMLLMPLYMTSFFLWDLLAEHGWYEAEQVVIVSASSKTSLGLAYALDADQSAPRVVGLTSENNVAFVSGLGIYDHVLAYENLDALAGRPTVIVDMSGNSGVLSRLHQSLDDAMLQTINVGLTHWSEAGPAAGINAERSEFFFAPSQIQARMKEWGPEGFAERTQGFFLSSVEKSKEWLELKRLDSLEDLASIFPSICDGDLAPRQGLVVDLHTGSSRQA